MAAANSLNSSLRTLFTAISESYPELRANTNFLDLQNQLKNIEGELESARRYYNGVVKTFNTKLELFPANIVGKRMGEGYEKTKPWHPLYNIVLFTLFGWLYLRGIPNPTWADALATGGIWAAICIVFDVFGWVLIKHPWSLNFREFYIDYQPWITLIYLAIFLGPVIGFYLI